MSEDQASQWRAMKQRAIAGDIRIGEDLGRSIADVISRYIAALEVQRDDAKNLNHLNGWGGLPSARAIRQKLENKAAAGGADDPDDAAAERLDQHIAIARDQRDTFLAAIGQLQNTDQQSASTIMNEQR